MRVPIWKAAIFAGAILGARTAAVTAAELDGLRISALKIFGNVKTKSYVIVRELPFRVGDPYSSRDAREAKEAIAALPGIDFVDLRAGFVPADSSVVVTIIVSEVSTLHGYLLTERGYENKVSFGLRTVDENFRGRSEKLEASFLLRGNTVLEGGWENPWVAGSHPLGVGFRTYYRDYRYPYSDLGDEVEGQSITDTGLEVYLFTRLTRRGRLSLRAGFETVESPADELTITGSRDRFLTVGLQFSLDTREHPAFPWEGVQCHCRLSSLGPGSPDYSLFEGELEVDYYYCPHPRVVLASQAYAAGITGDSVPAYRRFHLGGASTLRGFDYGTFNGNRAVLGTLELRIPVNFSRDLPLEDLLVGLAFTAFVEGGGAWEKGEDPSLDSLHGSFGAGVALLTKNATGLRFDYGWTREGKGRWEIDAGLKF